MKGFPLGARLILGASILALAIPVGAAMAQDKAPAAAPLWAFPGNQPAKPPGAEPITVAGSKIKMPETQVRDRTTAVDWFPAGHPAMPSAVKGGNGSKNYACGYCHLPQGPGRTESADVAGMPYGYLRQQLRDMKSGARAVVDEAGYELRRRKTPLGRLGREEDLANAIAFLFSREADFITGAVLNVDGGCSLTAS